ncbi:MAG: GNAT family N-acetyltransferase [Paludibacteraceae bacterium]|nr:GNAT family N-acetyltransferase [Paludibacteraceae bacterium]
MEFSKIDNSARNLIKEYLTGWQYTGSEYSYYAYISWFDNPEWAECDNALYIRASAFDKTVYWVPLVKVYDDTRDKVVAEAMVRIPIGSTIMAARDTLVKTLDGIYTAVTNRDDSEYIYESEHFISMSGKHLQAKRNHIHKFQNTYDYTFLPLTAADLPELYAFEDKWMADHPYPDEHQNTVNREAALAREWFNAALSGELYCDILRVDGTVAGVSIGEIQTTGNAIVLYEKADIGYEGAYSFLAKTFAENHFKNCQYINRQEDMGLPGLRASKLSYHPTTVADKYWLTDNFRRLKPSDYSMLMTFYNNGISTLKDPLWYKNYTEQELQTLLQDGYVLGLFSGDTLISVCAFDPDKEYGNRLASICNLTDGIQMYEFSGLMTLDGYRGSGYLTSVAKRVLQYVKDNISPCRLCAVVQHDNTASLHTLKSLGFTETAEKSEPPYRFKYLTLKFTKII